MKITIISEPNHVFSNRTSQLLSVPNFAAWWQISKCCELVKLCYINSFAADFLAPSAGFLGVKIWKQAIPLTFVNTATIIANGTEGVLSTLVANGTGTVSTTVAKGSERVSCRGMVFEKQCWYMQQWSFRGERSGNAVPIVKKQLEHMGTVFPLL